MSKRQFPVSNVVDRITGQAVPKKLRNSDDYDHIAGVIGDLKADIICIQEVDMDGNYMNDPQKIDELIINPVVDRINQNHDFGLLPLDQPGAQDIGFLYNKDKFEVVGGISTLNTFSNIGGRKPVISTFKLKERKGEEELQFTVICGHYKYPSDSTGSNLQKEQFEALINWMEQNSTTKVIVLGDFNSDHDSSNNWVRAHANILYNYAGWIHLDRTLEDRGDYTAWESARDNNFYDHVFISDEMQSYYNNQIEVYRFDELNRSQWGLDIYRISNHRPLKAYFDP